VLSAANSEGGQKMLERNHKLRVGQVGIVGYVAGTGKPRIALDTGADAIFFNNPDLPETRSEMALPLIQIGGQIVGVLDIQSIEPNAFNREDIEILITLADQVSVAIANARLYEETQKTLIEAEMLYRRDLKTGWNEFTRSQQIAGVRRIGLNTDLYSKSIELPGAAMVIRTGNTYFKNDNNSQMTIPVKLRGEIVGILNVKTDEQRKWTDDEMDVINAIVERAALSIESARLLQEAQKRADKERVIGEISAKIGSSSNLESILQTAIQELGNTLPGTDIAIQFKNNQETE
jgi:GAF domain-containing protein